MPVSDLNSTRKLIILRQVINSVNFAVVVWADRTGNWLTMKRAAQVDIRAYLSKRKLSNETSENDQQKNLEPADGQNEADSVTAELVNKSLG